MLCFTSSGKQSTGSSVCLPQQTFPNLSVTCRDTGLVFLNGILLGAHRQATQLCASFRHLRRSGRVGEFVSIYLQQECCYIASDGGRWARLTSAWA